MRQIAFFTSYIRPDEYPKNPLKSSVKFKKHHTHLVKLNTLSFFPKRLYDLETLNIYSCYFNIWFGNSEYILLLFQHLVWKLWIYTPAVSTFGLETLNIYSCCFKSLVWKLFKNSTSKTRYIAYTIKLYHVDIKHFTTNQNYF